MVLAVPKTTHIDHASGLHCSIDRLHTPLYCLTISSQRNTVSCVREHRSIDVEIAAVSTCYQWHSSCNGRKLYIGCAMLLTPAVPFATG